VNEVVLRARDFAVSAHAGQQYGTQPYAAHLDEVAKLLSPHGDLAQVVGYLHDVAEDTDVSLESIGREFGDRVKILVALVTDEPGQNRRERKVGTNAKLAAVSESDSLALIVKAADRLANVKASAEGRDASKLKMYRREQLAFQRAVYRPGLCDDLWNEMATILGNCEQD